MQIAFGRVRRKTSPTNSWGNLAYQKWETGPQNNLLHLIFGLETPTFR